MSFQNNSSGLADHTTLFNHSRCTTSRASIVQDLHADQYETARKRLKQLYTKHFDITHSDWRFLKALASVRNGLTQNIVLTHGDENPRDMITTNLLKGHGPIRDLYDVQPKTLIDADLLRYPRIRGEQRERIIYKPYYVLTPEATDCISANTTGPGVGDLGESVTHAVGARLYGQFMKHRVTQNTDLKPSIEYYDDLILDDHDIDVAVRVYPPGKSHEKELYAIGEVKTVLGSDAEAINSLYKTGVVQCEHKHWIAPRRELINKIINIAAHRGWYTLDRVPDTLPLQTRTESGIRSTNDRIANSDYAVDTPGLPPTTPLTEGFSYELLYRELKESDPTIFDLPRVGTATL